MRVNFEFTLRRDIGIAGGPNSFEYHTCYYVYHGKIGDNGNAMFP